MRLTCSSYTSSQSHEKRAHAHGDMGSSPSRSLPPATRRQGGGRITRDWMSSLEAETENVGIGCPCRGGRCSDPHWANRARGPCCPCWLCANWLVNGAPMANTSVGQGFCHRVLSRASDERHKCRVTGIHGAIATWIMCMFVIRM